jgi:hypothetical protein
VERWVIAIKTKIQLPNIMTTSYAGKKCYALTNTSPVLNIPNLKSYQYIS